MTFIPHPNRVLVKPLEDEGILSETKKEIGKVLAVGKDCKFLKMGDTVYFDSWGIGKTEIDGSDCYILLETKEFILGKTNGTVKK